MTKVIRTSISADRVVVALSGGQPVITAHKGFRTLKKYILRDFKKVSTVSEETYRHGGKAAAGAVVGGLLTGGVGLIAGAAIGGRRRKEGMYTIHLTDGNHVTVETTDKKLIAKLRPLALLGP